MTCSSCVATVTKAIESIRNVKNVTVSLDPGLAIVESNEDCLLYTSDAADEL